jgi:protein phosphatase PTC7
MAALSVCRVAALAPAARGTTPRSRVVPSAPGGPSAAASRGASVVARASKLSLIATGANIPHPDKVAKGGEDAWFVRITKNGGGEMYVADGVGGFNEQGVDPGLYARVLTYEAAKAKEAASRNPLNRGSPKKLIQVAQEATKLPGASTMVVVECDGTKIKGANLGDSGFRVVRGGEVVFATPAQEHYFNCPYQLGYEPLSEDTDVAEDADEFEFTVKPGDLVVAGSDGLFDNVFDDEIAAVTTAAVASVAGAGALSAARAASEQLAAVARKHAEDPLFESPYAVEAAAEKAGGAAKQKGPMGMLSAFAGAAASAVTGKKLGGKMDDITVVVGAVVATDAAKADIAAAEKVSAALQKTADQVRKRAAGEEAKTMRSVTLRQTMDAALKDQVAEKEMKEKKQAAAPPEFAPAALAKMDAPTLRKLLDERGLPTSGKIDRLRERLGAVKRGN